MPFLEDAQVCDLLEEARTALWWCGSCLRFTVKDYCRSCDEFYWMHGPECSSGDGAHDGHRLTIVPFVEDRTK